jgi:hypothetical protein
MTKFQVCDETESLGHGDVPESLEARKGEGCETLARTASATGRGKKGQGW